MLMILPLLSRSETDYSTDAALREIFWFGRSTCEDENGFFCKPGKEKWLTEEGWNEILRSLVRSGMNGDSVMKKQVLWI
jgi:hypothetical protein